MELTVGNTGDLLLFSNLVCSFALGADLYRNMSSEV